MLECGGGVREASAEGMLTFLAALTFEFSIRAQISIRPVIFHENILVTVFSNSAFDLHQKHKFRMGRSFQWEVSA